MASTYLTRAATGSVSSDKTFTMSVWLKRSSITGSGSADHWFMHENASSHTQKLDLHFVDDEFRMGWYDGSNEYNLDSKMKFRDVNAFYHIVFRCDTTQATASNRVRLYVNGEQADLQQIGGGSPDAQQPSQNATINLGQKIICIGRYQASSPSQYFNGCMSHMHYCDGQSYAPTEFGETDSTTGEWKIKPDPSLTYGNNGFWLFKNDNAVTNRAAGTSSGNFTVAGGTLTKTEDNPSNVFATLNPLDNIGSSSFSNGNLQIDTGNSNYTYNNSTLGYTSGKYYWEAKITHTSNYDHIGITSKGSTGTTQYMYASDYNYTLKSDNGVLKYKAGGSTTDVSGWSGASFGVGNIISIAHDVDNNKIYFAKDGVWMNSANPNTPTGGITTTSLSSTDTGVWLPAFGDENNGTYTTWQVNFGNGYFGTTAVSSAGTNASGNGIFEYDVPTGYTALSTKGLNL